jgi:gag-polyprotein putative aspartyl protease/Aspartyl protease
LATLQKLSRRQFVKYGASSLAMASIVAKAQTASPPLGSAKSAITAAPEREATPINAATDAASHLMVDVRINGNGPYHFIVDTGADRSIVASEVAVELGLSRGEKVMLKGVVRAVLTETVSIRTMTFGSITKRRLIVPTLSRSLLDADGYLGLDFLDGHRVTFDFKNHLLQVSEPRARFSANWVRENEARIRASGSSGHLQALDCMVDGVPATAFIDSGAEVSAANEPLLAALARRNPSFGEMGSIRLIDITGGEILGKVAMVNKIRLAATLTFTDCPLVIADFLVFDVWGLRQRPALLIGMNLLRQFGRVSIDYGLQELRFDLAADRSPPKPLITMID